MGLDTGEGRDVPALAPTNRRGAPPLAPAPMLQAKAAVTSAITGAFADEVAARAGGASTDVPADESLGGSVNAMIVRTGTAAIRVPSLDSATGRVRALAAAVSGYVANSVIQGGHDQARTASLEVKAPSPSFDRLLAGLPALGAVESVNVEAEDVGEEYVDIGARIDNDRRLQDRLLRILDTRAGKLRDVLDVERELARVREEMERYEGRLRYLRAHAAMSTLTITVYEPVPIINRPGANPIVAALRDAWANFVGLMAAAIAASGLIVPIAAVGLALWWGVRRRHRPLAEPR